MRRGTELFEFLNADPIPTAIQIQHHYNYLMINDDLKAFRGKWRRELKKTKGIRKVYTPENEFLPYQQDFNWNKI